MTKLPSKIGYLGAVYFTVFLTIVSCGKDDKSQTSPEESTITDIAKISSAPDRRALVGNRVDISQASVQSVVGTYIFWAGEPRTGVVVAREDRMRGPVTEHVRAGERCRITGTVRLLETVPATDLFWDHVTESERRDILGSQVYIAADRVSVIR